MIERRQVTDAMVLHAMRGAASVTITADQMRAFLTRVLGYGVEARPK